jgi:hypothetical protein
MADEYITIVCAPIGFIGKCAAKAAYSGVWGQSTARSKSSWIPYACNR